MHSNFLYITPINASLSPLFSVSFLVIIAFLYPELSLFGFSNWCHGQYYFLLTLSFLKIPLWRSHFTITMAKLRPCYLRSQQLGFGCVLSHILVFTEFSKHVENNVPRFRFPQVILCPPGSLKPLKRSVCVCVCVLVLCYKVLSMVSMYR